MRALEIRPKHDLDYYKEELLSDNTLQETYLTAVNNGLIPLKHKTYDARIRNNAANVVNYYAIMREARPEIVIETGTATGSMTSWILSAMQRNGRGRLLSIDIPPRAGTLTMDITLSERQVGLLIPAQYRSRWDYHKGDAKLLLPTLLAQNSVDVFIHDSLHTRTHMLFEYNVARALLKPNALIISDDILCNKSFFAFVSAHSLRSYGCISNPNLGLTINSFDEYESGIGTGVVQA